MAQPPGLREPQLPFLTPDHPDSPVLKSGRLPSYIRDHRKRLRERFRAGGARAMPDYELLEMVLFRANARADMKPLARLLLDHFGDFNAVLSAPIDRLQALPGVGDAIITELKLIEAAAQRLSRARILNRPVLSSWEAVLDYCHSVMSHRDVEHVRLFYLYSQNILIADEEQARGTVDHAPLYPREVVKRALELNASSLILVHNHPSGNPTPSQADIDMTAHLDQATQILGLTLHDHIVIGRSLDFSFRAHGLL